MSYNLELLHSSLDTITKQSFEEAIFLAYRDGITSLAPLGFSGDSILLFGTAEGGRKSVVSIRNYCSDAELLITDAKGSFLFSGRFMVDLGLDFVAEQYWQAFLSVRAFIEVNVERGASFRDVRLADNCQLTEGFAILLDYQKSQRLA